MKHFLIICTILLIHSLTISAAPTCPEREKTNCKNCQYFYPKRLNNLSIKSPLFDTNTLCARCFSLDTASQRNDCYRCMTTNDKVLRNRNELWCPLYAGNFKQAPNMLNLIAQKMRPTPTPLSKAKKTDACPKAYRRLCIDCKYNYPKIAKDNGLKKVRYDGHMLCATCFALPERTQQQWCYDCITNQGVMLAGNEPWCHAYAANFNGSAEFLSMLQSQYHPPIPDDY